MVYQHRSGEPGSSTAPIPKPDEGGEVSPERRRHRRLDLSDRPCPALLWSAYGEQQAGRVKNLSEFGLWVELNNPLRVGTPVLVRVSTAARRLTFTGCVARKTEVGMGLAFQTSGAWLSLVGLDADEPRKPLFETEILTPSR